MSQGKHLKTHEVVDPTRQHSRAFRFELPNGEIVIMELTTIPKSFSLEQIMPVKPSYTQVIQAITAAAKTNITHLSG